jgi:large subunit ribosomal protein L33
MAAKRDNIVLQCTVCGEQNYISTRNKRSHPDKLQIKKFCRRCNKETLHKEAK